jgi:NitT/TauT family transport system ATP-binding protein
MGAAVEFDRVTVTFASSPGAAPYTAVKDVSLAIGDGEFVSVVGPTGCGKTTLLNVVAGLLKPSSGQLRFGEPWGHQPPRATFSSERCRGVRRFVT